MTEKEKMLAGMIYDPADPELVALSDRLDALQLEFNSLPMRSPRKAEILKELMPNAHESFFARGPIHFDYGCHIYTGKNCYANFNFTALDVAPIHIGDNVLFGPNVSLMTPMHPFLPKERNLYFDEKKGYWTDKEYAKPITIGSNCWFASNVTVCGGVTIGDGCIIGAGSVVTRDIPPNSLAAGVPAKVIRSITKEDSIYLKPELWEKK